MRARGLLLVSAFLVPAAGVFFVPKEHLSAVTSLLPAQVIGPDPAPPLPAAPPPLGAAPAAPPVLSKAAGPAASATSAPVLAANASVPASPGGPVASEVDPDADPATLATLPAALIDDGSDDLPALDQELDPEPPAPPEPQAPPKKEKPKLASAARETWVFSEPRWSSRKLGYLRAGSIVERRAKPTSWASCSQGWYRIEPRGFVCANGLGTLDVNDPVVIASAKRPAMDGLPYLYAMGRFPTPPFYTRLPTRAEQLKVEPDLLGAIRKNAVLARDPSFVAPPDPDPIPAFLENGAALPGLANTQRSRDAVTVGRARVRSGFALLGTYEHEGRRFGLTTDLTLIPLDRARIVKQSAFHGITLDETTTLPVAFVRSKHAYRYTLSETGALSRGEPALHREAVPITNVVKRSGGVNYLQATDGSFVNADQVVKIDRFKKAPAWAAKGRKWVDVSILRQALVAYEGEKPVYVTLVSTGADGIGDPKKTHSTIQGAFLIHTKHLTVTMDGDQVGDEFDFRDVPFVQYFTEGFALHAAYWHDEFGTPRSHGCVNLAPIDAAWLFGWTDPPVPEGWHAALSLKRGTLVYTHP
ncbi:MAG: L,D-transpeptidase [Polyangiaceae bacterium]